MHRSFSIALVLAALVAGPAVAQEATPRDSLRSYDLAEIVVSTPGAGEPESPTTLDRLSLAALARQDAASAADVMRLVPSTYVQTNSRGEALVYMRNAGDRQVALFFDGALLNVPWDNRVDMSLVPAGVVGGVTVVRGVPSVLYGTNVLGGAVNLTSRTLGEPGRLTELGFQGGAPRSAQVTATHVRRGERLSYTASAGYVDRRGDALAEGADLPFSQADDHLRTNTDRRLASVFGSASYRFGDAAQLGLSLLHVNSEKGVAPESHLDPSEATIRYWRYPTWRTSMLIVNGSAALGPRTQLRGAAWGTRFEQAIDQYHAADYAARSDRQEDDDRVAGTRLTLAHAAGPGTLRLAVNALTTTHAQRDLGYDDAGVLVPFAGDPSGAYPVMRYSQQTFSTGAEYEAAAGDRLTLVAGGSVDAMRMPRTGDKPARDPFVAYGVTTGAVYTLAPAARLRAAAGRKVRFPTMRELFGEALRRFQVNPDLRPETSFLAEAGVEAASGAVSGEAVVFLNRTYDTIDQETLGDGRRRRVNLDGSRVYGVEVGGTARPLPRLSVDGHATWMHVRAFTDTGTRPLTEKPALLGTLTAVYNTRGGLSFLVQPILTGRAYSMDDDGALRRLAPSLVVNARLAYRSFRAARPSFFTEWFVRVDNVTDAVVLPQLGLPAPGREVRAGVNVTL